MGGVAEGELAQDVTELVVAPLKKLVHQLVLSSQAFVHWVFGVEADVLILGKPEDRNQGSHFRARQGG